MEIKSGFSGSGEVPWLQNFFFFFFGFSLLKLKSKLLRKKTLEWLNLHIFSLKKEKHTVDFHAVIRMVQIFFNGL